MLSDALFKSITHAISGIRGDFRFGIAAVSNGPPDNSTSLQGAIYIYKSKEDWRKRGQPVVRSSIIELRALNNAILRGRGGRIEHVYDIARREFEATADITLVFHLVRTGEIYLSAPTFRDLELERVSVEYADLDGQDFSRWVADQAYFFMRDISHVHQHHSPSADTILILQPNSTDEVSWRSHIIYALQHYVIRAKRSGAATAVAQSAGIYAYYMSFRQISERALGKDAEQIPTFNDSALLQSLNAKFQEEMITVNRIALLDELRVQRYWVSGLAFAALILAFLFPFVQHAIERDDKFNKTTALLVGHFWPIIAGLVIITAIVMFALPHRWQRRIPVTRDVLEAGLSWRRPSIAILAFGSAVIAAFTLYFFRAARDDIWNALKAIWQVILG